MNFFGLTTFFSRTPAKLLEPIVCVYVCSFRLLVFVSLSSYNNNILVRMISNLPHTDHTYIFLEKVSMQQIN